MVYLTTPAVLSGDFNDAIWPNVPLRRRAWHDHLPNALLYDPLYRITPLPTGPTHTRGAKRLDAFFVPAALWDILNPTSIISRSSRLRGIMQASLCILTSHYLLLNLRIAPFLTFATGEEETLRNLEHISRGGRVSYHPTCLCTNNCHEF